MAASLTGQSKPLGPGTEAKALAETVFSSLPVAVLVIAPDGTIFDIYAGTEDLFQAGRGHLIGLQIADLPSIGAELARLYRTVVDRKGSLHRSGAVVEPALGDVDAVDISLGPLPDQGHYVLTLHPKRLSSLLADARVGTGAADSLHSLASMLAHELKNPLAGIKGAAQLASKSLPTDRRHLTDMMQKEVDRIAKLVDQFDGATLIPSNAPGRINVHVLLDHVGAIVEGDTAGNVRIERRYDPSLPEIEGFEDGLVQVFLNLASNAQRAMEGRGCLLLETRYRHGFWVRGTDGRRRQLPIEVHFSDTGPGIAPGILDRLFEPFVTTQDAGTGLGLAIAAHHVKNMNGRITAKNLVPSGARFSLHLPLTQGGEEGPL